MPLIWDDFEWKIVNDEDPYDKDQFVVMRKVSVKPNTDRYDFYGRLVCFYTTPPFV